MLMAHKQEKARSKATPKKNGYQLYDEREFEYSDSDTSFDNLQREISAIAKREQPEVKRETVEQPVTKKMLKIPMVWLSKCPLEKITHNMIVINQSEKSVNCSSSFPLKITKIENFPSDKQYLLYKHRVEVAKYYCEREQKKYNFKQSVDLNQPNSQIFKQKQKDPPKNFSTALETILVQTCRNLEQFINNSLNISIVRLSRIEYREIYTLLNSLVKFFNQDFCLTFISFIKYTFSFGEVKITRLQQIIRLYKSIQLAVKLRVEQRLNAIKKAKGSNVQLQTFRQLQVRTKLKNVWNYQYEKFLLETYQNNQHFGHIREQFQSKFPEHAGVFAANQIKDRLCSIIRRSLKIIRQSISKKRQQQKGFPKLFPLDQKNFKIIMKSKNGVGIRLWLIDIYKRQQCQREELINIINVMNSFVEQRQQSQINSSMRSSVVDDTDQKIFDQDHQKQPISKNINAQQNFQSQKNDFYFNDSEQQVNQNQKSKSNSQSSCSSSSSSSQRNDNSSRENQNQSQMQSNKKQYSRK